MSSQMSIADEIHSARKRFDDGPLSARTLRAVEAMRSSSTQERVVDSAASYIANLQNKDWRNLVLEALDLCVADYFDGLQKQPAE